MLKFYFSKGSSALAAHILLEEVGAEYEAIEVPINQGAHKRSEFLRINPKGRLPVLETPMGVITENPAILEYVAAKHPATRCLPSEEFEQAQARSLAAYLCATGHVAFAHKHRGLRWASEDASLKDMQRKVPENLKEVAELLEGTLALAPWALGGTYSFCDPYLFLLGRWLGAVDQTIDTYPRLAAHHQAVAERPATRAIMALHGLSG